MSNLSVDSITFNDGDIDDVDEEEDDHGDDGHDMVMVVFLNMRTMVMVIMIMPKKLKNLHQVWALSEGVDVTLFSSERAIT